MAIIKLPKTDINQTMKGIHTQVCDSLEYCVNNMPTYDNPRQMYYGLLSMVKYKNDPPGIELLQSVPTLFDNNYWGISGRGDCDCFSILVLSLCVAHGWMDQRIVLAGRSKVYPVHIFTQVKHNGTWYTMDLTYKLFDAHRSYPFYQHLYV